MPLTPDEITAVADAVVKAVRECEAILIRAAKRPSPEPPNAQQPPVVATAQPALLTRKAAAQYLQTVVGYPVAVGTLAVLAVRGGGPPFQSFGRQVVYRPEDLRTWAEGRARRRTSTSDPGAPVGSPAHPGGPRGRH